MALDRTYDIAQFTKAVRGPGPNAGPSTSPKADTFPAPLADVDALGPDVPDTLKAAIVSGPSDPDKFPSRSEFLIWVVCELVRLGVSDELILAALITPGFKLAESVLDKRSGAERYARRQLARAKEFVARDADEFETDKEGRKFPSIRNLRVALKKMGVTVARNAFTGRNHAFGMEDEGLGDYLADEAINRLRLRIEEEFGLRYGKDFFHDVVVDEALRNQFDPAINYFARVQSEWDGKPRIDRLFVDYFGAADTPLNCEVARRLMVAHVRRVRTPGTKFDQCVTLEGAQGGGKSTAIRLLSPSPEWHADGLPLNGDQKEVIEATRGKMIVEIPENVGMSKAETGHMKALLSRNVDRARLSYAREPVEVARRWIAWATTNHKRYLRDRTGNRRINPIEVGTIDLAAIARDRDQLWAEAATLEAANETIVIDPKLWGEAARVQEDRLQTDPFEEVLEPFLGGRTGKIRAHDVWTLIGKADAGRRSQEDAARLGDAMRRLGWERVKLRFGGPSEWAYAKGSKAEREASLFVDVDPDTGDIRSVGPLPEYRAEVSP